MKHPYRHYTTEDALLLARSCKYGPLPKETDPMPDIDEAIEIIGSDPTMKTCNRITGHDAIQLLRASRGEEVEWS